MVAPVLEELAAELDGKLTIGKLMLIPIDRQLNKCNEHSYSHLFKDGQPIDQRIGALTKINYKTSLTNIFNTKKLDSS